MFGAAEAERAALEGLYEDCCRVLRPTPQTGPDGITRTGWKEIAAGIPCGLSEGSDRSKVSNSHLYIHYQSGARPKSHLWMDYDRVLFLPPEIDVRQGDRVEAIRFGWDGAGLPGQVFDVVGEPLRYATHTEVFLNRTGVA